MNEKSTIINEKTKIVTLGLDIFNQTLEDQDVENIHISWRPPLTEDNDILSILEKLK